MVTVNFTFIFEGNNLMDTIIYSEESKPKIDYCEGAVYQYMISKGLKDEDAFLESIKSLRDLASDDHNVRLCITFNN